MSIVLSCGHRNSGYDFAHRVLLASGLGAAHPTPVQHLSPEAMSQAMFDAYKISPDDPDQFGQIRPGKFWETMVNDFMSANMTMTDWGWADAKGVQLLDYWKQFDNLFKFVLVYSSPAYALASLLVENRPDPELVSKTMSLWLVENSRMLNFYFANKDRAILVNVASFASDAGSLVALAKEKLGLELAAPTGEALALAHDSLLDLMASPLVADYAACQELFQEMESAADLPSADGSSDGSSLSCLAWESYRAACKQIEIRSSELAQLAEKSKLLSRQLEDQRTVLGQKDQESALLSLQLEQSYEDQASAGAARSATAESEQLKDLARENELLQLQLLQLQEELEYYFKKSQSAPAKAQAKQPAQSKAEAGGKSNNGKETKPKPGVKVDLKQFIDGSNWWNAEADGRWAGPATKSLLRLPALSQGSYRMEIDIVDAMDIEILRGMKIALDGKPIAWKSDAALLGPWASFAKAFKKKLRYPLTLSALVRIGKDQDGKDLQLTLTFPKTLSPAAKGLDDMRDLAVRVRQVKLSAL
ncbi:hypothetical protein [Cohaesibacter haloalkalitolerans]|uniref:hypothetical protein n=1 Tax=Cohaesibacter haloalkalitolerans TaxID=1162980 RepID=UPI0013C3F2A3|nr:hypothetical protein [Cohaesibacter haloalkalitolerans]